MVARRLLALAALALAATVLAAHAGANRLRANPADQAATKRAVLKLADLPPIAPWKQTPTTASSGSGSVSGSLACHGYSPKESDLVTTGDSTSEFSAPGTEIDNEVTMLSSERMVQLDWKRSIVPALMPCLRKTFVDGTGSKLQVLSVRRVPFPGVATRAAAYRLVYGAAVKGTAVRGAADFIILAGGRVEISFLVVASLGTPRELADGEKAMSAVEQQLATTVAGRVLAPTA